MIEGVVKVGRMLRRMGADGGRLSGRGGDRKSSRAARLDNLPDLGFKRDRARRWQIAALLPDAASRPFRPFPPRSADDPRPSFRRSPLASPGDFNRDARVGVGPVAEQGEVGLGQFGAAGGDQCAGVVGHASLALATAAS